MDQPVRSLSSYLMSDLLQWRNRGIVEDFEKGTVKEGAAFGRKIVAEIGLVGIAAIALVGTAIYTPLAITEGLCCCCKQRSFSKILESCAFTLVWAVVDVWHNIFHAGALSTHESGARMQAQPIAGGSIFRGEDESFVLSLKNGYPSDPRLDCASKALIKTQEAGAEFLLQHIVERGNDAFMKGFREKEEAIQIYVSAKVIWIYAYGAKNHDPIHPAFSKGQRDQIEALRKEELKEGLEGIFQNLQAFEAAKREEIEPILKAAARTSESTLFRECWDIAITRLETKVNSLVDSSDGANLD